MSVEWREHELGEESDRNAARRIERIKTREMCCISWKLQKMTAKTTNRQIKISCSPEGVLSHVMKSTYLFYENSTKIIRY